MFLVGAAEKSHYLGYDASTLRVLRYYFVSTSPVLHWYYTTTSPANASYAETSYDLTRREGEGAAVANPQDSNSKQLRGYSLIQGKRTRQVQRIPDNKLMEGNSHPSREK